MGQEFRRLDSNGYLFGGYQMNIVITGASRGIGLELARQALQRGDQVFALARKPEDSPELQGLKKEFSSQLQIGHLDLTSPELENQVAQATRDLQVVDILINNAGVYRDGETLDDFLSSFQVNSVAPFLVSRALFPKLRKSKKPVAMHITSLMGSIEDNQSGGAYPYRASKAALNMISKTLAQSERWLISTVIHPGWVQTRMGGKNAPTSVEESARGIWHVIGKLSAKESGAFFDYEGEKLPW